MHVSWIRSARGAAVLGLAVVAVATVVAALVVALTRSPEARMAEHAAAETEPAAAIDASVSGDAMHKDAEYAVRHREDRSGGGGDGKSKHAYGRSDDRDRDSRISKDWRRDPRMFESWHGKQRGTFGDAAFEAHLYELFERFMAGGFGDRAFDDRAFGDRAFDDRAFDGWRGGWVEGVVVELDDDSVAIEGADGARWRVWDAASAAERLEQAMREARPVRVAVSRSADGELIFHGLADEGSQSSGMTRQMVIAIGEVAAARDGEIDVNTVLGNHVTFDVSGVPDADAPAAGDVVLVFATRVDGQLAAQSVTPIDIDLEQAFAQEAPSAP